MVGIEKMLTKKMCSAHIKWLKTLDFGMNYIYWGMKCKSK